jgi:hypothetical protein
LYGCALLIRLIFVEICVGGVLLEIQQEVVDLQSFNETNWNNLN